MKFLKNLQFFLLFPLAISQINQSDLDAQCTEARNNLIHRELRMGKVLSDFNKQIMNCSTSMANFRDLSLALDSFANMALLQSTVNNYETYENISTCNDINLKIILIDFEMRKVLSLQSTANRNLSTLNTEYLNMVTQASRTRSISSCVRNLITQTQRVYFEYGQYIGDFSVNYGNLFLTYFFQIFEVRNFKS